MGNKKRFNVDTLMGALYDRNSRPPEIENMSENLIVKHVITILRSTKLSGKERDATEKRLLKFMQSNHFNDHGRRRALAYFLRRMNDGKLKGKFAKKVRLFCKENKNIDWVKSAQKHT